MQLRVGSLTVRRLHEVDRLASGVQLPRYYLADINTTSDYRAQLGRGRLIRSCARDRGVYVEGLLHGFMQRDWVNRCAADYRNACEELDQSPAGAKARDLLFDFLTPVQRLSAERDRFIEITLAHPEMIEEAMATGKPPPFATLRFRIWRGFPNGNIMFGRPQDKRYKFRACLHPLVPYPTDDIVLGQLILLQSDPNDFIAKANVSKHRPGDYYDRGYDREDVNVTRLFGPKRMPELILAR